MSDDAVSAVLEPASVAVPHRPRYRYTVEQYLSFERGSPSKHDFFDGDIYAFIGANVRHVSIVGNLIAHFHGQLKSEPYRVYASQLRLTVEQTGLFTYPDMMIVHGKGDVVDDHADMVTNPQVVIEVVSPETADYDCRVKFKHYQTIPSLKEFLLIDADACSVAYYVRQRAGHWSDTRMTALDDVVLLQSIGCDLPLRDAYDQIEFPA